MPENPLLPNLALQKLYSAIQRARTGMSGRPVGLEAIIAAVAEQLQPGDAVLPFAHADAFLQLLKPAKRSDPAPSVVTPSSSPLAFAAGVAAGCRLTGTERLAVVLLDLQKIENNWAALLEHAQRERLPLILICPEPLPSRTSRPGTLDWAALSRVTNKLRFPVLTVDGADAVAMYRAMQESILRARHSDGPSLLWCLLPSPSTPAKLFPKATPSVRLENYLTARNIRLPRASVKAAPKAPSKAVTRR